MNYSVKFAIGLLGTTALALASVPAAHAAPFGSSFTSSGAGANVGGNPTVTSSSITFGTSGFQIGFTSANNAFASIPTTPLGGTADGNITGTVNFGAAGTTTTVATPYTLLSGISDGGYGTLSFTVNQVTTVSYQNTGTNGSFSIYILGDMGSTTASPTSTSLSLTGNYTGSGNPWIAQFTLANPPAPLPPPPSPPSVPEPASLALLGTGLIGLSALRRRRKQ